MLCDTLRPMAHHFVNGGGSKNSTIDQYKLNQVRTYYPDGKRKRAACLCFRNEARDEVLLVSSRSSPGYWVIPGGGLEPNETPAVAAERELEEEAGVSSRLVEFLGNFEDASSKHRTSVYASVVTHEFDSWEDQERIGRRRRWFSVEEASRRLMEYKPYQDQYLQVAIATRNHLILSIKHATSLVVHEVPLLSAQDLFANLGKKKTIHASLCALEVNDDCLALNYVPS